MFQFIFKVNKANGKVLKTKKSRKGNVDGQKLTWANKKSPDRSGKHCRPVGSTVDARFRVQPTGQPMQFGTEASTGQTDNSYQSKVLYVVPCTLRNLSGKTWQV